MDIKDIRDEKKELEKTIYELIQKFEQDTETTVTGITIHHSHNFTERPALMMVSSTIEVNI